MFRNFVYKGLQLNIKTFNGKGVNQKERSLKITKRTGNKNRDWWIIINKIKKQDNKQREKEKERK